MEDLLVERGPIHNVSSDRSCLYEAECIDERSGLYRKSAGEWQALLHLKGRGALGKEFVASAEQDLREAECFHASISVFDSDGWSPIIYDGDLFKFLLVLYVSNQADEFPRGTCDELSGLISFGQALLSDSLKFSSDFSEDSRALDLLEDLWKKGASSRGVGFGTIKLSEIADRLAKSLFFVSYPKRYEGRASAKALVAIRGRIVQLESGRCMDDGQLLVELKQLEREVVGCYKNEALELSEGVWEEYFKLSLEAYSCGIDPQAFEIGWGCFTVSQLKRLLSVCRQKDSLAASLFTRRPPKSVFLSHLLALYFCATHARLWLIKYWLPVYSEFRSLTYTVLGQEQYSDLEAEVLDSENGFQERVPSYVESLLRRDALHENENYLSARSSAKGFVLNVPNPICSRLKVPRYIEKPQDTDILEHSYDALGLEIHITLWYDSKMEYWLRVGESGANDAAAEAYSNTDKFLQWRAGTKDNHLSAHPAKVAFLA